MVVADYVGFAPGLGWLAAFQWILIVGFIFAFLVGFGMGANDVSNAFATVVGAGVLRLWQIYILASIMNILGGALMGYKVTTAVRQQTMDVTQYDVAVANFSWLQSSGPNQYAELGRAVNCPGNATQTSRLGTRNKYVNPNTSDVSYCVEYTTVEFLLGELSVSIGVAVFVLLATFGSMPVSVTQSVVGGTVGFSFALRGLGGINWMTIAEIVASWVLSPLLAGLLGSFIYMSLKISIFMRDDPFEACFKAIPAVLFLALSIESWSILYEGSPLLKFDLLSFWECVAISIAIGLLSALVAIFWGNKYLRRRALALYDADVAKQKNPSSGGKEDDEDTSEDPSKPSIWKSIKDHYHHDLSKYKHQDLLSKKKEGYNTFSYDTGDTNSSDQSLLAFPPPSDEKRTNRLFSQVDIEPRVVKVFYFLQVMSACFVSFAHGSNDTANAVGPLTGMYVVYQYGNAAVSAQHDYTLMLIRNFGDIAIACGLWALGHKVIKTMGTNMTAIVAPAGFCMELGTAFTVIFGNRLYIPLSTTHCAVGAVVIVGMVHNGSMKSVSWKLMGKVALAWIITLPTAAFLSGSVAILFAKFYLETDCYLC